MNIAMTRKEVGLLEAFLRCSRNYLEFGAGGSTYLAAQYVRDGIISVDSSEEWLSSVKQAVSKLARSPSLRLLRADIGATGDWGYPIEKDSRHKWPSYSEDVWKMPGAASSDLFLIDGRFRVCCFAEAIVRAERGAIVMIHDFEVRPRYHIVKEIARCIAVAESLAVFVKDESSDVDAAERLAAEYRLITA